MKPGSSKLAARGRQEASATSPRGNLGGPFPRDGPPLAIGPGRPPWRSLWPKMLLFLLRSCNLHENWHEIPHIQVTNSAPCSESGPLYAAPRGSAA